MSNIGSGSAFEALLSVIADPKAHQQRLQELRDQESRAATATIELEAMRRKVAEEHNTATAAAEEAKIHAAKAAQDREHIEGPLLELETFLHKREEAIAAKEQEIQATIAEHSSDITERIRDLNNREEKIVALERELAMREAEVNNMRAELNRKLATLRSLAE
jgi:chromosome segregation ATPase